MSDQTEPPPPVPPPARGGVGARQFSGFAHDSTGAVVGTMQPTSIRITISRDVGVGGVGGVGGGRPPSTSTPVPPRSDLVTDPSSMLETMQRLSFTNGGFAFYSRDESLRFVLRNDPESEAGQLSCELILVRPDGDDEFAEEFGVIMDLDIDTYDDDDEGDGFLLESFSLPNDETAAADSAEIQRAMSEINKAFNTTICACRKYLIRDGGECCLFCVMTSTPSDRELESCPICYEEDKRMLFSRQSCCGQHLHAACLAKWRATPGPNSCPMCRSHAATGGGGGESSSSSS